MSTLHQGLMHIILGWQWYRKLCMHMQTFLGIIIQVLSPSAIGVQSTPFFVQAKHNAALLLGASSQEYWVALTTVFNLLDKHTRHKEGVKLELICLEKGFLMGKKVLNLLPTTFPKLQCVAETHSKLLNIAKQVTVRIFNLAIQTGKDQEERFTFSTSSMHICQGCGIGGLYWYDLQVCSF